MVFYIIVFSNIIRYLQNVFSKYKVMKNTVKNLVQVFLLLPSILSVHVDTASPSRFVALHV
jgi:hypothetical protein